jgi:hypothetical protein
LKYSTCNTVAIDGDPEDYKRKIARTSAIANGTPNIAEGQSVEQILVLN